MSQEEANDTIEFIEHTSTQIGRCKCGEQHWHILRIGGAMYVQGGKC